MLEWSSEDASATGIDTVAFPGDKSIAPIVIVAHDEAGQGWPVHKAKLCDGFQGAVQGAIHALFPSALVLRFRNSIDLHSFPSS